MKKSSTRIKQSAITALLFLVLAWPIEAYEVVILFGLDVTDSGTGICWLRLSDDGCNSWGEWERVADNVCIEVVGCRGVVSTACVGNRNGVRHVAVEVVNNSNGICDIGIYSDWENNAGEFDEGYWALMSINICVEVADCAWNITTLHPTLPKKDISDDHKM